MPVAAMPISSGLTADHVAQGGFGAASSRSGTTGCCLVGFCRQLHTESCAAAPQQQVPTIAPHGVSAACSCAQAAARSRTSRPANAIAIISDHVRLTRDELVMGIFACAPRLTAIVDHCSHEVQGNQSRIVVLVFTRQPRIRRKDGIRRRLTDRIRTPWPSAAHSAQWSRVERETVSASRNSRC